MTGLGLVEHALSCPNRIVRRVSLEADRRQPAAEASPHACGQAFGHLRATHLA
jgi:hypothetical protein